MCTWNFGVGVIYLITGAISRILIRLNYDLKIFYSSDT